MKITKSQVSMTKQFTNDQMTKKGSAIGAWSLFGHCDLALETSANLGGL